MPHFRANIADLGFCSRVAAKLSISHGQRSLRLMIDIVTALLSCSRDSLLPFNTTFVGALPPPSLRINRRGMAKVILLPWVQFFYTGEWLNAQEWTCGFADFTKDF